LVTKDERAKNEAAKDEANEANEVDEAKEEEL
jgi:hypothetical protein